MSLDVYLRAETPKSVNGGSGIFVRRGGQTVEISRAEWDEKFPNQEPCVYSRPSSYESDELFSANVTHNLNSMAGEACIYEALWRPEEMLAPELAAQLHESEKTHGYHTDETRALTAKFPTVYARDLVEPLSKGLELLKSDPPRFEAFNPKNGWGSYEHFVPWVERYLAACEEYPDARVEVSR